MSERSSSEQNQAPQQQQQQQRRPQQQYYHQQAQHRHYSSRQQQQQQQHYYEQQQRQRYQQNTKQIKNKDEASAGMTVDSLLTEEAKKAKNSSTLKQQISTASTLSDTFSHTSKNCVCCLHSLSTYVTYSCMHYICLHCAVKLRIICEKNECPICRQPSESVICSKDTLNSGGDEIKETSVENTKFLLLLKEYKKNEPLKGGFHYNLDRVKHEYDELLSHRCKLCKGGGGPVLFATFGELEQHVRRTHQMNYCELCTLNLKLFTFERKFYSRNDLVHHRREGDVDDQSFKGHPNCAFCDERFFDKDELYRHYRKDHFYCHFCDADGHEEYYEDYPELRKHFKKEHHLCEIDECGFKGSSHDVREYSVFRSEIDFNAHKKLKHAKTKSEAKNYGKINIEFNVSNPIRDRIRDRNNRGDQVAAAAPLVVDERSHGSNTSSRSGDGEPRRRAAAKQQQPPQQSNLRDLYEKFAENQEEVVVDREPEPAVAIAAAAPVASTIISEPEPEIPTVLPSTWRDLISSGPVPRMNLEAEFPSLLNGPPTSSLASIGAAIAKQGSATAWSKKVAPSPVKEKKAPKVKVAPAPRLNDDNQMVNLKDLLSKPERNTQGETFTVLNKKMGEEEEELSEVVKTKKKDKKSKNKNKNVAEPEVAAVAAIATPAAMPPAPVASVVKSPPPGFAKASEQQTPIEQQLSKIGISGATSKNPPPGFAQPEPKPALYAKPQNYDHRNNELTLKLISLLDGAQFNLFKSISMDYHTQKLNAKMYMEKCKSIFAINDSEKYKKFMDLLQEMIILLPDISLQNQLYDEYLRLLQQQPQPDVVTKQPAKLAWAEKSQAAVATSVSSSTRLVNCVHCNQLLGSNELAVHLRQAHSESGGKSSSSLSENNSNSEFPGLPQASSIIFNNPQESLSVLNKKRHRLYRK